MSASELRYVTFNAASPNGFHCEVCEFETGPDETDEADAYDRLAAHIEATGHNFHNRGPHR